MESINKNKICQILESWLVDDQIEYETAKFYLQEEINDEDFIDLIMEETNNMAITPAKIKSKVENLIDDYLQEEINDYDLDEYITELEER